jgi:hypothetical protein
VGADNPREREREKERVRKWGPRVRDSLVVVADSQRVYDESQSGQSSHRTYYKSKEGRGESHLGSTDRGNRQPAREVMCNNNDTTHSSKGAYTGTSGPVLLPYVPLTYSL